MSKIERGLTVRVAEFKPHPMNYNAHPQNQVEALRESLRIFEQVRDVVVWREFIIAGHGVVEAAKAEGWTDISATRLPDDWDEERVLAYLAVDNETARLSESDDAQLAALLQGVSDEELRALAAGGEDRLRSLIEADAPMVDAGPQIDRAAELQEKWQVGQGQIWQAGKHFVICGDCREVETWERLLAAAKVDKVNGVFTSPPYAEQRKKQYGGVPVAKYVNWWEAVQGNVKANLAADGSFFVNIKPHCENGERVLYVFDLVLAMKRRWGWRFVDELCWLRPAVPKHVTEHFKNGFESIFQFVVGRRFKFRPDDVRHPSNNVPIPGGPGVGATTWADQQGGGDVLGKTRGTRVGLAYPSNVIQVNASEAHGHQAAFPTALPDFFIRAYSDPGDVWLDPFLGSGTTIVAAHNNNRRGLGVELLPKYVAVTLERLSWGLEPRLME